jgi:hypothetical protein
MGSRNRLGPLKNRPLLGTVDGSLRVKNCFKMNINAQKWPLFTRFAKLGGHGIVVKVF